MANDMNRRGFLKYAAASALGMGALGVMTGCSSKETASSSAASTSGAVYTPGTYTASAEGYGSDVTVTVTFDETSITNVVVDSSGETENVGAAAAEKLADQVLSAQSSAIDGVTGATKTSKAVKQAVADCISQASGGAIVEGGDVAVTDDVTVGGNTDWLGTAPEVAESDITETIETDVLVVGAGNAGLMTAARAASQGAKVLVIEKGMSSMNERHWIGAVGTTAAKEAGVEVDKNKLVAELCRYASHRCDERLIRLWVNHSGEAMDWYQEVVKQYNPDVKFHMEWDVGKGGHDTYYVPATMHNFQDDIPEHDYSSATAEYGFASLQQCVTDNGGEIVYEVAMVKLEQDGGKVTGVIAKAGDGHYIRIKAAKGVALCCGGYAADKQMLATLNPDAYQSIVGSDASALDTGDGIRAAMWVGADKDPDPTVMLFDRGIIAPNETVDGNWEKSGYMHLGSEPWLKVNLNGERFMNEYMPYDLVLHAAASQPYHTYCTVWDSKYPEDVERFATHGCSRLYPHVNGTAPVFPIEYIEGMNADLQDQGYIVQADTVEELADKLGLPKDTFTATVDRYNELAAKGEDEDYGKEDYRLSTLSEAPFYGVRQSGGYLICTMDGIQIDDNMHALDHDFKAIPGLYVIGDMSGNYFSGSYPCLMAGAAAGRSATFGRFAGQNAAAGI